MPLANASGAAEPSAFTVGEVTRHIKATLEYDELLSDLWVRGEVSQLSRPSSGHVYLTLRDGEALLKACIWRSAAWRLSSLGALPEVGEEVVAHGKVGLYEARGEYQLIVDDLRAGPTGRLHAELEALKRKLYAEGLFAVERKRPLPPFPRCIALITSPHGAALQDLLRIFRSRMPSLRLILAAALVQGDGAPASISAAISAASAHPDVELLIVARGGGSAEDLSAFNTEEVARAIAASRVPLISAVGHEVDVTIADLVADHRAPTPTAAAADAIPDREDLLLTLAAWNDRLLRSMQLALADRRSALRTVVQHRLLARRDELTRTRALRLDRARSHLRDLARARVQADRQRLQVAMSRLDALSPLAVLGRGYATITRRRDGRAVRSCDDVVRRDRIDVHLADGSLDAVVRTVSSPTSDAQPRLQL
jgi:exodeoxyribonuclease VII large subunit